MACVELLDCDNPFTPGDGLCPPDLISRHDILRDFETGLMGDYSRLNMRISGPRCSGKTALLIGLGEVARRCGWLFVSVAGNKPDLLTRIGDAVALPDTVNANVSGTVGAGASVGGARSNINVSGNVSASYIYSTTKKRFHEYLADKSHKGIVVALDEVQSATSDDMIDVCNLMQEMRMERANVAFIVAGKPGYIHALIGDTRIDYMRKAHPFTLGLLDENEIWLSLRNQFKVSHIDISDKALDYLVKKTLCFPMLVQYIGYQAYQCAAIHGKQSDGHNEILMSDCKNIVIDAYRKYQNEVLRPITDGATINELKLMTAMAANGGQTKTCDIIRTSKLDKSVYTFVRATLIEEGIIDASRRGHLVFSVPFLSSWIKVDKTRINERIQEQEALSQWGTQEDKQDGDEFQAAHE